MADEPENLVLLQLQGIRREIANDRIGILHGLQQQRRGCIGGGNHHGRGQRSHDRVASKKRSTLFGFIEAISTVLPRCEGFWPKSL